MKKMFVLLSVMIISFPVSAATLKQGDSSDQVMKLQQALTDGGYFSGTVDGQFDTMTEEAVRKYQEESGVTADGVVNDIQYMNLTFESIDNPEKSASDYDYADWVQFAEGYEKAHVRELQYDCYFVQDYIGNKLSDFCYINDTGLSGSDYFGKIEYELANFGEKYAEVPIESKNDLYNYTVVYQDPMPDFSVKHGSTDKLTVRLGVIYSGNLKSNSALAADQEMTYVDDENCTFKITGTRDDAIWGYSWDVYLENKTGKTLMFAVENVSVNGAMIDPFWATEVPSGMKKNSSISWSKQEFAKYGIEDVEAIEFTLHVYDSDDWLAPRFVDQTFLYDPSGNGTTEYTYIPKATDQILYNSPYCFVAVTGTEDDSIWGYQVHLYIENKTDKELMFAVEDAGVNGYAIDPFWAKSIAPGKSSFTDISWSHSALEENGIDAVNDIQLSFKVYDANDWTTDPLHRDRLYITPFEG